MICVFLTVCKQVGAYVAGCRVNVYEIAVVIVREDHSKAHCSPRFDGDGMIFACRIKNGEVNFSNQYIQTNRLQQEKKAGHPLGLKVL